MSIAEEKAWANALATKYGIREPLAPETASDRWQALYAEEFDRQLMIGTKPATTATA